MLRRELTSQLWIAFHILSITVSRCGSSIDQTSGPSNMMCESTPHALYDTSIPSALLSSKLLSQHRTARETNNKRQILILSRSFQFSLKYHTDMSECSGYFLLFSPKDTSSIIQQAVWNGNHSDQNTLFTLCQFILNYHNQQDSMAFIFSWKS